MSENTLGTVGLIHGYGHRAAHWDKLRPELEARGFDTIAVDLPADNPDATFADYARVSAEAFESAIRDGRRIDLLLHSMGSNVLPELVKIVGVENIRTAFHVTGSIGEPDAGKPNDITTLLPRIPRQRNTEGYRRATLRLEDGMTVLDPSKIRALLFGDCSPEDFIWALEQMRLQGKPKDEPPLDAFDIPGLNQKYILGREDAIRDRAYVLDKIAGRLGMKLILMDGGHSPAIARPAELADVIAKEVKLGLAEENTVLMPSPFSDGGWPYPNGYR